MTPVADTPLRRGIPDSATRHHAYEASLPSALEAAIGALAPALWERFAEFGYSGGLDCTRVAPAWAEALEAAGVDAQTLRAGGLPGWPQDRGGYLRDEGSAPWAHAYLALGEGLWLFDPTWGQFRRAGEPTLARYRAPGGMAFTEWRAGALGAQRMPRAQ